MTARVGHTAGGQQLRNNSRRALQTEGVCRMRRAARQAGCKREKKDKPREKRRRKGRWSMQHEGAGAVGRDALREAVSALNPVRWTDWSRMWTDDRRQRADDRRDCAKRALLEAGGLLVPPARDGGAGSRGEIRVGLYTLPGVQSMDVRYMSKKREVSVPAGAHRGERLEASKQLPAGRPVRCTHLVRRQG